MKTMIDEMRKATWGEAIAWTLVGALAMALWADDLTAWIAGLF